MTEMQKRLATKKFYDLLKTYTRSKDGLQEMYHELCMLRSKAGIDVEIPVLFAETPETGCVKEVR